MHTEDWIRADYTHYNAGYVFNGRITFIYDLESKTFFVRDKEDDEIFMKMEHYNHYEAMDEMPTLGSMFILKDNNFYYRTYSLAAIMPSYALFFVDTGETRVMDISIESCFKIPKEFSDIHALALFCCNVDSESTIRLEHLMNPADEDEKLELKVCFISQKQNILSETEQCLNVIVSKVGEVFEDDTEIVKSLMKIVKMQISHTNLCTKFMYKNFRGKHVPVIRQELPKNAEFPSGTKIIVYPGTIARSNLMYGCCKSVENYYEDDKAHTKFLIHMNKSGIQYEKFDTKPIVNEVVIAPVKSNLASGSFFYYRGYVNEIFGNTCLIILIDQGGKSIAIDYRKLYKLPLEYVKAPYHCSKIHITNIMRNDNPLEDHEMMLLLDQHIRPFTFGIVESGDDFEINVKLFDINARNMEALVNKNSPLYAKRLQLESEKSDNTSN